MEKNQETCFKAYDIRGKAPEQLNWQFAHDLGLAISQETGCKSVAIGRDARLSGAELYSGLATGLSQTSKNLANFGLCCTEEIYHAAASGDFDLGIMITGSHNPANENGFKIVCRDAIPMSGENGLFAIRERMRNIKDHSENPRLTYPLPLDNSLRSAYIDWLLDYSGFNKKSSMRRLKIVADAGNGCAFLLGKKLAERLPFDFIWLNSKPDGQFPNGVPNPLLPEKRERTAEAVRKNGADLGIAWDGDADRCFFYTEEGEFVEGYYLVGLLATELLTRFPGEKIIHDPRVYWNTRDMVSKAGGIPVMGKTGHAFMKERMRQENAIYGGEMSAHHYFRDFSYCDSGMIPWLLLTSMLANSRDDLSRHLKSRIQLWPCSGEINRKVAEPQKILEEVERKFASEASMIDKMDGLNMEFSDWRFNLRMSNTEALLRLNVESRGDRILMEDRTGQILQYIDSF